MIKRIVFCCLLLGVIAGCAVNPVTGQRELSLVGDDWDLQVGQENYAPMRQSQGGDYVTDEALVRYVQQVGDRVTGPAKSHNDLPYEFVVLNSSVPNAWALPGGKMAINRGLLTELGSEAELAAVLGHEATHAAARHGARSQSRSVLLQGAVLVGGIGVGVATGDDTYAGVAMTGGMLGATLINQRYSRDAEREADYYGMQYMHEAGYDPMAAVHLQETFVRLSEGRDAGFMGGLFSSHPPSPERVENNRKTASELGGGGEMGSDRYQRAIAGLKASEPAYKAHDEGRKALADNDLSTARAKAEEAIRLEPKEAIFHALLGDVLATGDNFAEAEQAYSRALQRDPNWFYHHLRRGMVREELGKHSDARTDLQASLERLPTAQAHYYLGNVERTDGNRQKAIQHYQQAAQAEGEIGTAAKRALQEMGA